MEESNGGLIKELALPLYNAKFWMQLMGVVMIIYGIMIGITIVGLIIAWLPIWIGVLLFQSASAIDKAFNMEDKDAALRSFEKLKVYFIINGVLLLIGIILGILGVFMGGLGMMGAMSGMEGMQGM